MGMKFFVRPARLARPARPGAGYLLPALLCLVTAAACGSVTGTNSAAKTSAPKASAPKASTPKASTPKASTPKAKVSLTVVVTPTPGATPKRWTLRCDPTGGTHPDAEAACRALLAAKNPFAPIPRGIMCPMIVAGPQKAVIMGTFFGQHVESDFSQAGCEASRWSKLGLVFGPVSGGTGAGTGAASGAPVN